MNPCRLRILTWELGGQGKASGAFDDDSGEDLVVETEEIMIPLKWEHASGCPPEFSKVKSLAELLLGSLVAWPDVVALALPEHIPTHLHKNVAEDLAAIFASRYPPALLILAAPPSLIQEFEFQAPATPHVERLQEMEGTGGEGWLTVIYKSAPGWVGRGSLLGDVNGEISADDIVGIAEGRGCVLVGNGPSLNAMTDDVSSSSSASASKKNHSSALRLLGNVTCVVGANKFWLGSHKFGFQPSVFVAQDVHVMQVFVLLIVLLLFMLLSSFSFVAIVVAIIIVIVLHRLGCIKCLIYLEEC